MCAGLTRSRDGSNDKEVALALSIPRSFSGEGRFAKVPLTADGVAFCAALRGIAGSPGCKAVNGGAVLEGVKMGSAVLNLVVRPVTVRRQPSRRRDCVLIM